MDYRAGAGRAADSGHEVPAVITLDQYFGPYCQHPDASAGKWAIADLMLDRVNSLLKAAEECGVPLHINPKTKSQVSGIENGGFRPNDCSTGAPLSKHKQGHAVDVYDPDEQLDRWITDDLLATFELWREAPEATLGWVHLQDVPPKSGRRTFKP